MVLSFLLPRRLSGGWRVGKGQHVCRPPGTCAGIHTRWKAEGPWQPWRQAAGNLSWAATEEPLPVVFPLPAPHEMVRGGEGGHPRGRSECENLGLADRTLTMRRGKHWGLGPPLDLDEVQV